MTPIQRPDPQGECQVKGGLARHQAEIFGSNHAKFQPSARNPRGTATDRLGDRGSRAVNPQNKTRRTDPVQNCPGGNTGTTADLQNPQALTQRQGGDGFGNSI